MKKLKYFFASAIVLVAVAVSTIVFAEYKEQKGDIRFGNSISNNSITVTEGNLVKQGDIQINKTVSKIDDNGNYKVTFEVKGKDVETHTSNKKDVYAVVVLDKSGSMCNSYNCSRDEKWTSAVNGAKTFAKTLHEKIPTANIALVTFADKDGLLGIFDNAYNDAQVLRNFAKADFSNVNFGTPKGGTNLQAGLYEANELLTASNVKKDAIKYVVVISDGEPTLYYDDNGYTDGPGSYMDATTEAKTKEMAKTVQKSAEVFAIGYDYNGTILSEVASGADHVYLSDPRTIVTKFTDIATIMGKANAGTDATLTDNIGAKFVMTDAQGNKYTSEKFDITEDGKKFSFNIKINEEDITEDGWYPTNANFELTYTDPEGNEKTIKSTKNPEVYWVAKRYNYKIEYYYDGQIDNTLTETGEDVKGKEITVSDESIKNNNKEGYSFINTDPSTGKIEISSTGENVIKVYYERNSYDYEVHYFYNGNEDISLKEIKSAKYGDKIGTYTDNQKTGYKFDRVENLPLTIKTKGNVINVYYVTDETQTKELSYTVEYYKDGKKVENDTQVVTETKQVLESDTLTVKKGEINVTDKYVGYKFEKTNPSVIPDTTQNGGVIEVYYVKGEFEYTIEYYYNGQIDKSKTENSKAKFESVINTYPDKKETGYKLDKEDNLPLTVSEDKTKNVIRVYYVTDETQTKKVSYTVEYYKDGVLVKSDTQKVTETKQVLENDELTVKKSEINVTDKYVGYSFVKTEPTNIPDTIQNNGVIKVYYERNSYNYEVHYFFNGNEDTSLIERKSAKYEDVINTYIDKVKPGYKLDRVETLPLIISTEDNIINVYYVTDDNQTKTLSYTVEYYKDGVLTDTEIEKETKQLLDSDTLTVKVNKINTVNKYPGYKFEKTNPSELPEIIEDGGVIKVYYVKDEFSYSVEYYYNGKIDNSKTETSSALFESVIDTYEDKNITGYVLSKVENLPLTISENETKNVIRVYYVKGTYKYTVNYYYDNVLDKDSIDTFEAKFEDVITTYEQKIRTGYVLDKVTGLDLTISADESKNVINVYYKKAKYSYVVEYYYDNVLDGTKTDSFKATYNEVIETYKDKVITGYELDKVEGTPLTVTEIATNNIIRVYYKKASYTYEVRYYFNRVLDETLTEKGTALFGEKITSYTDKIKEDYVLETVENLPLEISADESKNIINVYYKIDGQGVIEPIEPPHTSVNNGIYALVILVNALGVSVLLKRREN